MDIDEYPPNAAAERQAHRSALLEAEDEAFELGIRRARIIDDILAAISKDEHAVVDFDAATDPGLLLEHIDNGEGVEDLCVFDGAQNENIHEAYEEGLRNCAAYRQMRERQEAERRRQLQLDRIIAERKEK